MKVYMRFYTLKVLSNIVIIGNTAQFFELLMLVIISLK